MTPYYKLIDYWMMFSMVMLMVTMLFHTYLNKLVRDAKRKKENERRGAATLILDEGMQSTIRLPVAVVGNGMANYKAPGGRMDSFLYQVLYIQPEEFRINNLLFTFVSQNDTTFDEKKQFLSAQY